MNVVWICEEITCNVCPCLYCNLYVAGFVCKCIWTDGCSPRRSHSEYSRLLELQVKCGQVRTRHYVPEIVKATSCACSKWGRERDGGGRERGRRRERGGRGKHVPFLCIDIYSKKWNMWIVFVSLMVITTGGGFAIVPIYDELIIVAE